MEAQPQAPQEPWHGGSREPRTPTPPRWSWLDSAPAPPALPLAPTQGLLGNLSLASVPLSNWLIYPLDVDAVVAMNWPHTTPRAAGSSISTGPAIYTGAFRTPGIAWDTFVKLPGWSKVPPRGGTRGSRACPPALTPCPPPGPALDQRLQPGPVLGEPRAAADTVRARLAAQPLAPQQCDGAGAGACTSPARHPLPGPTPAQCHQQLPGRAHAPINGGPPSAQLPCTCAFIGHRSQCRAGPRHTARVAPGPAGM